ncbi:MAG: response regulator [Elusimicrobia bacterium]|nr:response regulator [Elusimicrobiota bacterium]
MEQEPTAAPDLADPKDKLILIIDDDESILDLIEHVVKREGFKVERGSDGQEALQKAQALNPDLIILDFMLPGMGGFEVVKELQMGETVRIPILVVTGRHLDRQSIDMVKHESNVREFMEKPIKPVLLSALLHKLLKTRPPEIRRAPDRGPLGGRW